jgi:two-component system sensor histidine kinase RegB
MTTDRLSASPDGGKLADDPGGEVRSSWLLRLRWGSVAVQLLLILSAGRATHFTNATPVLLGLALTMGATNFALWLWLRRRRVVDVGWSGAILTFDMIQLTALLHFSGGASNPFSVFYLVEITAAAATLGSRWTWFLTLLGVSGYATLFVMPAGESMAGMGGDASAFSRHLEVMWVALVLSAALTAFFVTRLTTSLAARDREILRMREKAAVKDRVSALATLAASAAHELATPLTTVAVVAGELERAVGSLGAEQSGRFGEDVRLIRAEVQRCREILDELGRRSGGATGEMPTRFTADELARDIASRVPAAGTGRVAVDTAGGDAQIFLPRRTLVRVALSLVQNALDASASGQIVKVAIRADAGLAVSVEDHGAGMTAEVLSRADEPFFTTKPEGQGLGLGLFLARSIVDQLGGELDITSQPAQGTTVTISLPLGVGRHDNAS